ncbi:hypothetical protein KFZ56_02320 [Virgibacillus sp. NKC19-3]|uniref:hypothetical protein n=1 Tax=Virgibacillus saliphilus TaxID=2831674 RepID=UPI001C9B60F4|nr:hypothetical protein [Virgibacillus sp. NKC19-3]MBY7141939.1 hypothetical protein [Virgibacillus sp. NKC19-3]
MFFSRWTLFQVCTILLLIVAAWIAEMFTHDIGQSVASRNAISTTGIMTYLFMVVVIGLLSLLMYFLTKKSDTFLKHRLWEKMHMLIPMLLLVSLVGLFSFFLIDPLSDMMQNHRWVIYVFFYYILFLILTTDLAIIHKAKRNAVSNEMKVVYSFV